MIAKQLQPAYDFVDRTEAKIPKKYWIELVDSDKPSYIKLMRESRIALTKQGYYDKDTMHLLKKIRCNDEPSSFECALNDE